MHGDTSKQKIWTAARNAATFVGLAMLIYNGLSGIFGLAGAATAHAQQTDPFLSRRVDMLEQRLYSIESRLNQVSIQTRPAVTPLPSTTQNDIDSLRTNIDSLRLRVGEVECGLLRIDERTLTAAQRRSNRTGSSSDRCRDNYGSPIMLSARP